MLNATRALLVIGALGLGLGGVIACGGGTSLDEDPPTTQKPGEVVNQQTGLKVSATIASASLGEYRATNMQIAFFASQATQPAKIVLTKVVLINDETKKETANLTASGPQVWNGRSYETWNEQVTPGGDLKASYTLTQPDWSTIDGKGTSSVSYRTPYKLRVTMTVDGTEVVIESGELRREAPVVT